MAICLRALVIQELRILTGRHFVDEAAPPVALKGSGVPGFHRKGYCRSAQSGNVAIDSIPAQGCRAMSAGSDSRLSIRRDIGSCSRLYIVNGDEVMCKAESARRLQRRSSNPCVCHLQHGIPANIASSQALSCRRGAPYSSRPISRRCPPRFHHRKPMKSCAQADRRCFL